jgi:hypothetical protein
MNRPCIDTPLFRSLFMAAHTAESRFEAVAGTPNQYVVFDEASQARQALIAHIERHVQMALDPRISEAAAALVLAAKIEALEWAATLCTAEADEARMMARHGGTAFDDGREQAAQNLAADIRAGKGYTS